MSNFKYNFFLKINIKILGKKMIKKIANKIIIDYNQKPAQ